MLPGFLLLAKTEWQRPDLPFHLKQSQKAPDKFDETAVFKTPSTSDEWEWSREMRTTEVSPTVAPEYCLERVSRPWHKEEKVRQDAVVPWVEETELRWEELQFIGQNTREKRGVLRSTWRDAGNPLTYSAGCSWDRKELPTAEKKPSKRIRGTLPLQVHPEFRRKVTAWLCISQFFD